MKESDWKVFKEIKDKAIEKYCTFALKESQEVISDKKSNVHNRYLLLYKLLQNSDKKMALLFDGHSRSKALIQLIAIRSEGLADETLLSKLSDEVREKTDPENHGW
ncbi:hypothetical protein H4J58_06385 [Colwellia sp. MB3u-70]|jgi:hypothetical protein|uniref:hypothetical protein n=1 Tax=unclassified Colwellia TaxID=196834 RepID=UPI0015F41B6F|nr:MULTISPECIES: hypothetical protein [unclassified Colwellia]MBA6293794.1 hypothetical protein [Colwellia sp. MB3u-8]MBA6306742.1 hypothetical protein [Colwellia sp. MB3u-70]